MKKLLFISAFVLGTIGVFAQAPKVITSDKTGWHKIGETTVDFKKERDEISVIGADKFASIKFRVLDEPIDLVETYIVYESGDDQKVNINTHIKAPGDTREINLTGGERSIKKIGFVYRTLPNAADKKARIEIWGLKTNADSK